MINSWKRVVLSQDAVIKDALQIINTEALRVALVVDETHHLKGVVTDGDIRRGLLTGKGLDAPVADVMNINPITADVRADRQFLIDLMIKRDILIIPLIDHGKLVGLETLHGALVEQPKFKNPVFIMAGGFGTRLRPLTDNCPKPMLEIGSRPILETIIASFIKAGFTNFYISTHYMPEKIEAHFRDGSQLGARISYVFEEEPLGTGGSLGLLPNDLPDDLPLIVMNGDVLTNVDYQRLLEFHMENDADATICVRDYDYQVPYGVINGDGNRVTGMVEKPIQRFFVNAGIYVISPAIIKSVSKNQKIDMPTLLEHKINDGAKVLMFPIHEYWLDIGRMEDFNQAQSDIVNLGILKSDKE